MNCDVALKFHFRPAKGWINDPNGLVYFNGYYHVFYQNSPNFEDPWHEPMCWGHARTKDFLKWEELPVALAPSESYDRDGCWSGTAVVMDGTLYLFYAAVVKTHENGADGLRQTVCMASSMDGIRFTKHPANPLIAEPPAEGCKENFRDPAVIRIKDTLYIMQASSSKDFSRGRLLLYESADAVAWKYNGVAKEFTPEEQKLRNGQAICECPSFVRHGNEYLLATSLYGGGAFSFAVFLGSFDGENFVPRARGAMQRGPDQYAGQIFEDEKGRNIFISWIGGWHWQKAFPRSIGCMSIPMEIYECDGRICAYPIEEVRHLLKDSDDALTLTDNGFKVKRANRDDVVYEGPIHDLKVLRDEYVLEIFVNGGEEVYAVILD